MQYAHRCLNLSVGLVALFASAVLLAQQPAAPPASPAASTPDTSTLSASLGVYAFPAKNQTAETQSADEGSCFGWAKTQTGIDPMSLTASGATQSPAGSKAGNGNVVKGAAGGAAGGAVIGAIAGDAGKGAAIGAGVGALTGAAKRRAEKRAAAQQQAAAQQAQASAAEQKATYNKAYSACMEGKGYTVK